MGGVKGAFVVFISCRVGLRDMPAQSSLSATSIYDTVSLAPATALRYRIDEHAWGWAVKVVRTDACVMQRPSSSTSQALTLSADLHRKLNLTSTPCRYPRTWTPKAIEVAYDRAPPSQCEVTLSLPLPPPLVTPPPER